MALDGKPCVTSVTIFLIEKTFAKRHPPLTDPHVKDQKTIMLTEDHDKTRL